MSSKYKISVLTGFDLCITHDGVGVGLLVVVVDPGFEVLVTLFPTWAEEFIARVVFACKTHNKPPRTWAMNRSS